mmetsp:Transcript_18777/g.30765  ORF Transcript_18777/g.30765 Transcript_18777/m.30765 type:complete len:717 (-) Transcript_18777:78-2228(-)
MSSNTKMDSSSPAPPNHTTSSSSSNATGLISPFAQCTNNSKLIETDISLPLQTPQVDSYQISHIAQARARIKQSIAQSPLLLSSSLSNNNSTTNDVNDSNNSGTTTTTTTVEYIFPRFDKRELLLGKVLGSGGFGTVLEIRGIRLLSTADEQDWTNHNDTDGDGVQNDHPGGAKKKKRQKQSTRRPSRIKCRSYDESGRNRKSPVRSLTKGIRTRALSLNAKAHDVLPDVGHFFHHHGDSGGSTTANATVNGLEQHQETTEQQQPTRRVVRQISRNFSLKAWGDSDPGDEGKDAISPEEMERYKFQHDSRQASAVADGNDGACTPLANEEEKDGCYEDCDVQHQTDCLLDEVGVCPGTNHLSTVVEKSDELRPDSGDGSISQFSIYDTIDHSKNNDGNANNTQQQELQPQQRRRIVFFQPQGIQQQQQQDKQYISENATTPTGESRYVIKIIQPEIVQSNFKKFLQAAMDMATETKFLSVLNHPHILNMRAVGQGDMFSPEYFLVLDRLYDTLLDRIEGSWRTMADHLENDFWVWSRASKVKMLWVERMSVMRDVAGALMYIHSLGIIYRDIKPENIGFDANGVVKLFDFGLAKEVRKEDESSNGTYKLTPNTGSLRYMAPEVGNKWPYNFLADTYSFGIMLWEVSSLQRPFENYTPNEIRDMVMKWGERPKVKEDWPDRVKQLMTTAWDSSFRKRPTMEAFRDALEEEVMEASHV